MTRTSSSRPRSNKAAHDEAGDQVPRLQLLQSFLSRNGLSFRDPDLLEASLTHRSCVSEQSSPSSRVHNERLEFLGDAVLGLAAAHLLYSASGEGSEGDMSRIKSQVVSEPTLAGIALDMGMPEVLKLGRGEELSGGRKKQAILADALEALIGAFFLDSGWEETEKLVQRLFSSSIRSASSTMTKDSKTSIQEYAQKHGRALPRYSLVRMEGPEHDRLFWVSASLGDIVAGPCSGKTKKEAEQSAASALMEAVSALDSETGRALEP